MNFWEWFIAWFIAFAFIFAFSAFLVFVVADWLDNRKRGGRIKPYDDHILLCSCGRLPAGCDHIATTAILPGRQP